MNKFKLLIIIISTLFAPVLMAAESLSLDLGYYYNVEFAGVLVGVDKGWYKDAGIDLKVTASSDMVVDNINSNKADIGISSSHRLMKNRIEGFDFKSFAVKFQIAPNCIVVDQKSKIRSISDLKGKTIGYHRDSDLDYYKVMLNNNKLTLKDVKLRKIKSKDIDYMINLFKTNQIDSLVAWQTNWPIKFSLKGHPVRVFQAYKNGFNLYGSLFYAKSDFIKKNKNLLSKFLRVTFDGWKYAMEHPKKVAKMVTEKWYPKNRYINDNKTQTYKQQLIKLTLSKHYLLEGVGVKRIGLFSRWRWRQNLLTANKHGFISKSNLVKDKDLYDSSVLDLLYRGNL